MTVKCESRSKGEVTKKKHLCPAEQAQFSAFFRQTEASRKRARRVSHAWKEGYKKRTISLIEEAWICRTGAVFQRFFVKRRLARSERENASREREGVKKKPRKITCTPMHTKIEKPRKTF